ncbi:MAG: glycosyl hydrolase 2 galactose-binding domain-containing protein [Vibrio sp.]
MQFSLAGPWQLSPLTDLSIPQDDITFPAPLSLVLPATCSETEIVQQEWHLMHDIEVDKALLSFVAIDLVLAGIEHYAEVRLNGVALFDCDGSQAVYRKEIRQWLQLGRNRFEILFLHADDESLLDEPVAAQCRLDQPASFVEHQPLVHDPRVGIWQAPYLQGLRHLRLTHVSTEQVWHHGGCELLVNLFLPLMPQGWWQRQLNLMGVLIKCQLICVAIMPAYYFKSMHRKFMIKLSLMHKICIRSPCSSMGKPSIFNWR